MYPRLAVAANSASTISGEIIEPRCPKRSVQPVPTDRPQSSRHGPGRLAGSLLCLVTGWPLLKRPHVAVGVTEIGVQDAAHILHIAQFHAPLRQSGPGRSH